MVAPNSFGGVAIAHHRQLGLTSRQDSPGVTEPALVLGRGHPRAHFLGRATPRFAAAAPQITPPTSCRVLLSGVKSWRVA